MPYTTIRTQHDVQELANHLSSPHRDKPVVIVSTSKAGTVIDPDAVAARLGSEVEVYLLASGSIAYELEDLLPEDMGVYGGAARSYPPGTNWAKQAMVRLAYTPADAAEAVELIAGDVADMEPLFQPVRTSAPVRETTAAVTASGTVTMVLPGGGVAKLEDGSLAVIDTSSFPGDVLKEGMAVTGTVTEGNLDITAMTTTASDALATITAGRTYLARVNGPKTVELFPGLNARCRHESAEGAVIAVRVDLKGRLDGKGWKLIPVDAEAEASPSALSGSGIPWLQAPMPAPAPLPAEETAVPVEPEPEPQIEQEPAAPVLPPVPAEPADHAELAHAALDSLRNSIDGILDANAVLQDTVDGLTAENARLKEDPAPATGPIPLPVANTAEIIRLTAHVQRLTDEKREMVEDMRRAIADADSLAAENRSYQLDVARLRDAVRTERERAARARSTARDNASDEAAESIAFTDPEAQFRHEVYMQWITRVPAAQKESLPLADYGFGPDFLDSVDTVQGVDRTKVVSVAMEILTGLAESMPGREMHRMRTTASSNAKDHPVYGTFWRVSLQVKTASARRLHFWRGEGGRITFANVGVHDDALN